MLKVGIIADYREEGWASMDLMAEMLLRHLPSVNGNVTAVHVQAPFRHRVGRVTRGGKAAEVSDRVVNRFFDYPRWLRAQKLDLDIYHVVDHSYAHLVHALPRDRTVVTCHDVDAFRSLIGSPSTSLLPRRLARHVLDGLRAASVVVCNSEATRADLLAHDLLHHDRLDVVHPGAHPACSPAPNAAADQQAATLLGNEDESIDLLHVGTTIERKRIDLLLDVIADVATHVPTVRLVRIGGPLTTTQRRQAARLGIESRIVEMPLLDREALAAVYRRAALVLMPSDREGFGLPVVEALACGAPVVASDIPALREVGGEAVVFCPPGDRAAWSQAVARLLGQRRAHPAHWQKRKLVCVAQGERYTWTRCATQMASVYGSVAARSANVRQSSDVHPV